MEDFLWVYSRNLGRSFLTLFFHSIDVFQLVFVAQVTFAWVYRYKQNVKTI
jgi:hypothetical protein